MSIFDKVKDEAMHQFIEVIEWLDNTGDTIVYRFPVQGQEIKNGAQLIVRESQAAVFVHEGQVADVFGPGRFTIDGGNTPILSKLGAWKYGFNSPFKSEVYFVNTKQFTDMKWARPTRSCCAIRILVSCGCGRSAPTACASPTRADS